MEIAIGVALLAVAIGLWFLRAQRQDDHPRPKRPPTSQKPTAPPSSGDPREKHNVLEGIAGDVKGRTFFVGQRTVTLGRGQTNFIQTTDDEASRIHCHIKPQGEGLLVSDMSSKNGFKINQALVSGKGLLRDGDVLAVGKATFVFHRTKRVETDASLERKRVGKFVAKSTVQGGADLLNKSD